jgi:hypothetical protein
VEVFECEASGNGEHENDNHVAHPLIDESRCAIIRGDAEDEHR